MRYSFERDWKSGRADGRVTRALAAQTELIRRARPELSLPEDLSGEKFPQWQLRVRERLTELLRMPERTPQPEPKRLSTVQRDGYRTERWEFYPDDVSAIPVLLEIPDGADAARPAPLVLCFPGSNQSKEFFAGEPLLDYPPARRVRYPERNQMGRWYVKSGMIACVFDPLSIGESAMPTSEPSDCGNKTRRELVYGLLMSGRNYLGLSVFQASLFLDFLKTLPFVDKERVAVSGHSLGSEIAVSLAVLRGDVKALVFNDFLSDPRIAFTAVTDVEEDYGERESNLVHILPGFFSSFGFQDLCAAAAPRYLALNEGGAEEYVQTVQRAYAAVGCPERLQVSQYPKYAGPESRTWHEPVPDRGLTAEEYYRMNYVDVPDHSFRAAPSLRLLRTCFRLPENES